MDIKRDGKLSSFLIAPLAIGLPILLLVAIGLIVSQAGVSYGASQRAEIYKNLQGYINDGGNITTDAQTSSLPFADQGN